MLITEKVTKRSNINLSEIKKNNNDNKYEYYFGVNTIFCSKDNNMIEITPISILHYDSIHTFASHQEQIISDRI